MFKDDRPEDFTSDKPIHFPCMRVRMVPAAKVTANDYNPNRVAGPELDLLAASMEADGVTQPIVAYHDAAVDRYVVIDGFHRYAVLARRFGCEEIPVVPITRDPGERMAATVRHNRARGEHRVELMGQLVESLLERGMGDEAIAERLGMEREELLRLKQLRGVA